MAFLSFLLLPPTISSLGCFLQELCKNVMSEMNMKDFVVCYGESRIPQIIVGGLKTNQINQNFSRELDLA